MHRDRNVVAVDQAVKATQSGGLLEAEQKEFEKVVETKARELSMTFELSRKYSRLRSTSERVRYS